MTYDSGGQGRRSIRLPEYDYAQKGAYFVTVCTHDRMCLFGDVENGEIRLNLSGRIVREEWLRTAEVRCAIELDKFVVMPNHLHGIILITNDVGVTDRVGATRRVAPTGSNPRGPISGSVGAIIGQFKSVVTKRIKKLRPTPGAIILWQRNYYEHIIRDAADLKRIREYIANNPGQWETDHEHPNANRVHPFNSLEGIR